MKRIAPHLRQTSLKIANAWLHEDAQGRFLIDTGHPLERLLLMSNLWQAGVRTKGDLTAVLLTHRHADHAGNAAFVRKFFGARVYCHADEAEILRGNKAALADAEAASTGGVPAGAVGGALVSLLSGGAHAVRKRVRGQLQDRFPAFTEIDDTYVTEGEWRWGFRVLAMPGHTGGSVMLHHPATRTLYAGDAILVGQPFRPGSRDLRLPDPELSELPEVAHRSLRRFLADPPPVEILCPGHGHAITEGLAKRLRKLGAEEATG